VKPLYWPHVGDVVVFASELKSVLASGFVEPELDLEDRSLPQSRLRSRAQNPSTRSPQARSRLYLSIGPDAVPEEPYWSYPEPNPDSRPPAR
jgi:hypothetical protein